KEGAGKLKRMQQKLAEKMSKSDSMRKLLNQVRMVDTTEGIRIDLVDNANFSMFRLGTTVLTPDAAQLLMALGQTIAPEPGSLTVRGHTDSVPYKPGDVANNWSLSAGRAEATRQALMRNGIKEDRFKRIEGVADRELLIPDAPHDPRNRRISIVVAP
ncbi:MAG TPA: OmpA family protein, partial [Novosphingobium sp.]